MSAGLAVRGAIGTIGVLVGVYGAALMLQLAGSTLVGVAKWLVAGVILHDFVLAPLTVGAWWLARRYLPAVVSGPLAGGVVVLGSITIMAIPVLVQWRVVPSNPSLLDRDYSMGLLIVAGIVATGVVAWAAELFVRRLGSGTEE
ncbi:hypothetical protein KLP28_15575 [Nocardioidaceae bacterium]|nr:hypothetical protein KLP28_15575 [Nocardioidaceae bacterium]